MIRFVAIFRNVQTGELLTVKVRASTVPAATNKALERLERRFARRVEVEPWELRSVRRTE